MAKSFELGQQVATPGALQLLANHGVPIYSLIARHASGDWGCVCASDKRANDKAVMDGGRIFSAYEVGTEKVWVITTATDDDGRRESTCVLLPSEY